MGSGCRRCAPRRMTQACQFRRRRCGERPCRQSPPRTIAKHRPDGMTSRPATCVSIGARHATGRNLRMAANQHLVLAFFNSEAEADEAGRALGEWAKSNPLAQLGALGVLVEDEYGSLNTHKLGPRQTRKGIGIGAVLGVVGAVATGGLSLVGGAVVGGASGGAVGTLFPKRPGVGGADTPYVAGGLAGGAPGGGRPPAGAPARGVAAPP